MTGNKGFTLLEILVAATLFAVAVGAISSLFVTSLRGQRNIIAQQNLVDNMRFALEHMARQIRMAQRDEGVCASVDDNAFYSTGGSSLSFKDFEGDCVTYRKESGSTKIEVDSGSGTFLDMTSDDIKINVLDFSVQGSIDTDGEQPRVTIFIESEAAGGPSGTPQSIRLQTTVSARNLDVP